MSPRWVLVPLLASPLLRTGAAALGPAALFVAALFAAGRDDRGRKGQAHLTLQTRLFPSPHDSRTGPG